MKRDERRRYLVTFIDLVQRGFQAAAQVGVAPGLERSKNGRSTGDARVDQLSQSRLAHLPVISGQAHQYGLNTTLIALPALRLLVIGNEQPCWQKQQCEKDCA